MRQSNCGHCGKALVGQQKQFCSLSCANLGRPQTSLRERFAQNYIPEPMSGCWLWIGSIFEVGGYGRMNYRCTYRLAHHIAYELFIGEVPKHLKILHKCDTRSCVNPDHLYAGTSRNNSDDMVRRGRSLPGERHPRARLTNEAVRQIRHSYIDANTLGRRLGVSPYYVRLLRTDLTRWAHVQ